MKNRNKNTYESVDNVNDIPGDVYDKVMDYYLYLSEYNFDAVMGRDENEVLLSIYNAKYVGKDVQD